MHLQFYKSLMNIKQMILNGEDVQILGLHFQNSAGNELVKDGRDVPVTNANALTYIYLLAKVRNNGSISLLNGSVITKVVRAAQVEPFRCGIKSFLIWFQRNHSSYLVENV